MMRRRVNPARLRAATIKAEIARRGRDGHSSLPFETDRLMRRVIRPALIALMATSVAAATLVVVNIATPGVTWFALLPLVFAAALEGAFTAAWISNPESHGVDKGVYRAAEIFILLALSRLYSWFALGGGFPGREALQEYLRSPLLFFASHGFITTVVVVFIAWGFAGWLNRLFNELDLSADEMRFYTMPAADQKAQADNRPIQLSRGALQGLYTQSWLAGGMVLVVFAALSTFEVSEFASVPNPVDITRIGLQPVMLVALLAYFLVGFWLQSHARLLRLNARWLSQGMTKDASIDRGWRSTSLRMVLLIALAAAFLPLGSTNAPSRIIAAALNAVFYGISLIVGLFSTLLVAVLSLFTPPEGTEATPLPTLEPLPPPPVIPPQEVAPPNETVAFVASSAFWTLLVMVSVFALLYLVRERGLTLDRGRATTAWHAVVLWLRETWARLRGRVSAAGAKARALLRPSDAEQTTLSAPPTRDRSPRRFFRLSALSPRDQVRYFYLSTVRRAEERGIRRQNAETPLEYVVDLKTTWPEAGDELDQLTEAFLTARYAPRPIEPDDVGPIRATWKRVKSALRNRPADRVPDTAFFEQRESEEESHATDR